MSALAIGMPVRNGGDLLDRAISSLRAQSRADFDLLISDNASEDDTAAICARHARDDDRIRYERTDSLISMEANFDRVLRRTRGPLFMWAAHDDVWEPHHVERLTEVMTVRPDVALAAATPWITTTDGEVLRVVDSLGRIAATDPLERAIRFIAAPEADGKASLFYGVHRRAVLEQIDPLRFWNADRRRNDYHLLLAVLCHGDLHVDGELRFTKTEAPPPDRRLGGAHRWVAHAISSTRAAWGWVDAYATVVGEHLDLSDADRRRVRAAVRHRRSELVSSRARRALALRP